MDIERIGQSTRERPAFQRDHEYPHNPQESQELADWFLGAIDDLVDESARFINEELQRLGVGQEQRQQAVERIQFAVTSVWARDALNTSDLLRMTDDVVADYLERKFGIRREPNNETGPSLEGPQT